MLVQGQKVRIRLIGTTGEWCEAKVALVGQSVVALLLMDAVRTKNGGVVVGSLRLLVDFEKERVTGLDGSEYEIEDSFRCPG